MFPLINLISIYGHLYKAMFTFNHEEYNRWLRKLPSQHANTPQVNRMTGRLLSEISRNDLACEYFMQAFKVDEFNLEFADYFSSALWVVKNKRKELEELAKICTRVDQMNKVTFLVNADYFSLLGDRVKSTEMLEKALEIDPDYSLARTLLAHELVQKNENGKGKVYYNLALSCDFRNYRAHTGLGNFFYKINNISSAIQSFKKSKEINPFYLHNYSMLSDVYLRQKEYSLALAELEMMETKVGENGKLIEKKANVFYEMGCIDKAKKYYELLQSKQPNNALFCERLGVIYKELGKEEEALNLLRMAILNKSNGSAVIMSLMKEIHKREVSCNESMEE